LPSSDASSGAIDFVTALGRLLRDGALRDAFALDPTALADRLRVREGDRPMFLQLVPADLEFQAQVLLKKRFGLVRRRLPQTCARLGNEAWPMFRTWARNESIHPTTAPDAHGFCEHLAHARPVAVCPFERNRMRFTAGRRRCAVHFIVAPSSPRRTLRRPCLQLLLGRGPNRWHEFHVSIGL
jgi:hypothetical protein